MDASLAAFVLGTVNLALLSLLFLAWRRDKGSPSWRLKTALRLQEHDQRLNELHGLLKEQDELRRVVRGELMACLDGQAEEIAALKKADVDRQTRARLAELASCVDAQADEIEAMRDRFGTIESGMSLETASLRMEFEALREEMEAVELACGPEEGAGTMKREQSMSGWKTALQNWKTLLGALKGLLMPLWRVLQRGK